MPNPTLADDRVGVRVAIEARARLEDPERDAGAVGEVPGLNLLFGCGELEIGVVDRLRIGVPPLPPA
ncbi:MAG: hypothetical protein QOK16_2103 [Solirubrobacteraceae bacterium]|jgi:hypothetical protein|nr:hypothetical protein [Solirubrobacteraceae bacterium]